MTERPVAAAREETRASRPGINKRTLLPLTFPGVLLLWVLYHDTLRIWFREDDLPLLVLTQRVHSLSDFVVFMFRSYAQGTVRPLSERLPFLISYYAFGYDCLPFRAVVLLTTAADAVLLAWLARRLSRSNVAAALAPMVWVLCPALVSPLTWNSSYNEVQLPFFLLAALNAFIVYHDSGKRRWFWLQIALFVAGLGSLESMVVYPLLAAGWTGLFADPRQRRRLLVETLPMLSISIAYVSLHLFLLGLPRTGAYAPTFGAGLFATFREYLRWAVLSPRWAEYDYPSTIGFAVLTLTLSASVLFAVWRLFRRDRVALFCFFWFAVTLAPVLPFQNRHTEYYLAVPDLGLALLAGYAVETARRAGRQWICVAVAILGAWAAGAVFPARAATRTYIGESTRSRGILLGLRAARETHPKTAIVLDGITDDLYRIAIRESGLEAAGVKDVYLTPGSDRTINPNGGDAQLSELTLDKAALFHALRAQEAVVYEPAGDHLRNITSVFAVRNSGVSSELPRKVEPAIPLYGYLLGSGWLGSINGVRWMSAVSHLAIGVPHALASLMMLRGYCPEVAAMPAGHVLEVRVNGVPAGKVRISNPGSYFQAQFAIPPQPEPQGLVDVELRASPTKRADGQDYGMLIEGVSIKDPRGGGLSGK